MAYTPKTIEEYGGILAYLDLPEQVAKHNGLGSKEFAGMVFNETPVRRIMKRMNVKTHDTVDRWIRLYRESQSNHG